ncbi:MAG: hypothetical protein ACTHJW_23435 [Streptosporangiaceae bacterium]
MAAALAEEGASLRTATGHIVARIDHIGSARILAAFAADQVRRVSDSWRSF